MASELKTQIAKKTARKSSNDPNHKKSIRDLIRVMEPQIKLALPSAITPERFTRIALSAVSNTPKLAECTQQSFLAALMNAAQLGLEPNTPLGQAYLIPFYNNRKKAFEAQFQIGYKGLIDLAHRSGDFKNIYAMEVYEHDHFEFEYGLEPKLIHVPAKSGRGEVIYYYAVYTLTNGGAGFSVMSREDVERHAKRFSKAYSDGPWQTNFDEMAKKTLIKKVLKYAPIKTEFARQISQDETIKSEMDPDMADVTSSYEEYEVMDDEVVEGSGELIDYSGTPFDDEEKELA